MKFRRIKRGHFFSIAIFLILTVYFFENKHVNNEIEESGLFKMKQNAKNTNSEWINLNDKVFFRLNTSFYLHDQKKLLIFLTCNKEIFHVLSYLRIIFNVEIYSENNYQIKRVELKNVKIKKFSPFQDPINAMLSSSFNLNKFIEGKYNLKNIKVKFIITLSNKPNQMLKTEPIQVNIKETRLTSSRDIFICCEPTYLEPKDYRDLKWFIRINSQIGFKKIVLNNNSIPNTKVFNQLFEDNANFVKIIPYNYLPNIVKPAIDKTYFHHLEDLNLNVGEWGMDTINFLQIDNMAYNECIFTHSNQANLIFIIDIDETFIPSKLKKLDNKRIEYKYLSENNLENKDQIKLFESNFLVCEGSSNYLRNYLDFLTEKHKIPKDYSLYVSQGFYFKQEFSREFFKQMELVLAKNKTLFEYPVRVKIYFEHIPAKSRGFTFQSLEYNVDFTLLIRDYTGLNYARSILNLYKYLIEPFLLKNSLHFSNESERFGRFLYMENKRDGKTFINQATSEFMESAHAPDGKYFNLDDLDLYHLSHFRDRYKLGRVDKDIELFHLDLNYFACYVKPFLMNLQYTV